MRLGFSGQLSKQWNGSRGNGAILISYVSIRCRKVLCLIKYQAEYLDAQKPIGEPNSLIIALQLGDSVGGMMRGRGIWNCCCRRIS